MIETQLSRPKYPVGIPSKFSVDGVVQRYSGNTTLCHVPTDSSVLPVLLAFYAKLERHPTLSPLLAMLPPASWHMTVFDGMRETECEPGMWPEGMEKSSLAESTTLYRQRLAKLGHALEVEGLAPPYRVRVRDIDGASVGIGLVLEGATLDEERRLRRLRDRISDTLGFRAPNHEIYHFHISMAYFLRHIEGADRDELHAIFAAFLPNIQQHEVRLGPVEFCTFEHMLAFPRVCFLGDHE